MKRNQAIFVHLLKLVPGLGEGVFVNPPMLVGEGVRKYTGPNWRRVSKGNAEGVRLVTLSNCLLDWHVGYWRTGWARAAGEWLRNEVMGGSPFTLWVNSGARMQATLAQELRPHAARMVCDWSDDFWSAGFGMRTKDLDLLSEMADAVVAVNEAVARRVQNGRTVVCRNGTNPDAFRGADPDYSLPPIMPKPAGAVYVGFTGGLNTVRVDRELLRSAFERFRDYTFVFVGYVDRPEMKEWLSRFRNVRFVDEVPYEELKHVIHSFDAAMVPHLDNEHTRGNDLLKVLDYLACGVPVVSTDSSGAKNYGAAVRVATSRDDFLRELAAAVAERGAHDPARGYEIVRERSWENCVSGLAHQLGWLELPVETGR